MKKLINIPFDPKTETSTFYVELLMKALLVKNWKQFRFLTAGAELIKIPNVNGMLILCCH